MVLAGMGGVRCLLLACAVAAAPACGVARAQDGRGGDRWRAAGHGPGVHGPWRPAPPRAGGGRGADAPAARRDDRAGGGRFLGDPREERERDFRDRTGQDRAEQDRRGEEWRGEEWRGEEWRGEEWRGGDVGAPFQPGLPPGAWEALQDGEAGAAPCGCPGDPDGAGSGGDGEP